MKVLYLDCTMGAAGDMLMAALLELHPDPAGFMHRLNAAGIPGVKIERRDMFKCGIKGSGISVLIDGREEEAVIEHGHHHHHEHEHDHDHSHEHHHEHHHTGMREIRELIESLNVPTQVRENALAVYELLAEAESHAHGRSVEQIHFHEVGSMDAVADIVGVCLALHELAPDKVVASRIHVGSGTVRCAHGILPVPAPATAHILMGVPTCGGTVEGELCTPTGAALLRRFASEFVSGTAITVEKMGCGMGKRHFYAADGTEVLSAVRAVLGETESAGEISELVCNIDDMTGEELGFAAETLLDAGALDVFTSPIYMKKSRPAVLLTVICSRADAEKFSALIFRHTTTLGIRERICSRRTLERSVDVRRTARGEIRFKTSEGYGVSRVKPEYEDLAAAAKKSGASIFDIKNDLN